MVGVDVVDVARLRESFERSPRLEHRLFTETERDYCRRGFDPVVSFAGTLAAKEAVIKALRLGTLAGWAARVEITRDAAGTPRARVRGDGWTRAAEVSISHDGGIAAAVALALP